MLVFCFLFFFFQTKKLIIHLIDDFHVINVPTTPNDKASSAIHMASSLLDIQPAMAVAHPVDGATIHSTTYIKKNGQNVICRGGILKTYIVAEMTVLLEKYHQTYLASLPTVFHSIAPDKVQQ